MTTIASSSATASSSWCGQTPDSIFANNQPIALYNPHFDKTVGTWARHGRKIVRTMESIPGWNFVVAPHVKLRGGPAIRSDAGHIVIDRGSTRSIDMSYTQAASVYIGDASSQVYEFIRTPRACIFLNLERIDWHANPAYAHWHLGQVIESADELPAALARAHSLQAQFEPAQLDGVFGLDRPGRHPCFRTPGAGDPRLRQECAWRIILSPPDLTCRCCRKR